MVGAFHPLVRELPGWRSPLDVLPIFSGDRSPALLLSAGPEGASADTARWSFLCADPFETVRWDAWRDAGDPFQHLDGALSPHACAAIPECPFTGGAVGWIGYDARLAVEPVLRPTARKPAPDDHSPPAVLFGLYGWTIAWDHSRRCWAVIASGAPETGRLRAACAREQADRVARRLAGSLPEAARAEASGALAGPTGSRAGDSDALAEAAGSRSGISGSSSELTGSRGEHSDSLAQLSDALSEAAGARAAPGAFQRAIARAIATSLPRPQYIQRVRDALDLVGQGELYQVNLSQRIELPAPSDSAALLSAVARMSPSPFAAWLDMEGTQVVCASPERFVRLRGLTAQTRPIKGTRPRGRTPEEDARLREELLASSKDRAENVMIVDLERNDLGRVCVPGSVRVDRLCAMESYASVHHLVSEVSGELAPQRSRADLLRAMFPGGSMTGAPKVRAMIAIDELEPVPRDIYSGSIGYLSFSGEMDLNIVIRTLVIRGRRAWLHAGGGIVADSVPEDEFAESLHKARSVREALGAAFRERRRAWTRRG